MPVNWQLILFIVEDCIHRSLWSVIFIEHCTCINKYGSYLLIMDWAGLKWNPVLKALEQLQDKRSEEMQNSYQEVR